MANSNRCTLAKQNGRRCGKSCSEQLTEYSQGSLKICPTHLNFLHAKKRCDLGRLKLYGSPPICLGDELAAKLHAYFSGHPPHEETSPETDDSAENDNSADEGDHEAEPKLTNNKKRKAEGPIQDPLSECKTQLRQARDNMFRLKSQCKAMFGRAQKDTLDALRIEKTKVAELAEKLESMKIIGDQHARHATDAERRATSLQEEVKVLQNEVQKLQEMYADEIASMEPRIRTVHTDEHAEYSRKMLEEAIAADNPEEFIQKMMEDFMESLTVTE